MFFWTFPLKVFILKYPQPLIPATLLKRYKRFLADVRMADGSEITVHTPNTGSMLGCAEPGSTVWLRDCDNPKRKYRYSWDMSQNSDGVMIGVNTGLSNHLVREGIETGVIEPLQGYPTIRSEVRYGEEKSRIDLLLEDATEKCCYVEVKNVTALGDNETAFFPDAVTTRGTKHLRELKAMVEAGHRAVIFYCVQRGDARQVRPADEIDPEYSRTLRDVVATGVEAMAWRARVTPEEVVLEQALPVVLE